MFLLIETHIHDDDNSCYTDQANAFNDNNLILKLFVTWGDKSATLNLTLAGGPQN